MRHFRENKCGASEEIGETQTLYETSMGSVAALIWGHRHRSEKRDDCSARAPLTHPVWPWSQSERKLNQIHSSGEVATERAKKAYINRAYILNSGNIALSSKRQTDWQIKTFKINSMAKVWENISLLFSYYFLTLNTLVTLSLHVHSGREIYPHMIRIHFFFVKGENARD